MVRSAYQPFAQAVGAAVFATLVLSVMLRVGAAQPVIETLPRYGAIDIRSDSVALVRAADDALQGRSSMTVPMSMREFRRERRAVVISLQPVTRPGIEWRNLGGTVRILSDGRRLITARR